METALSIFPHAWLTSLCHALSEEADTSFIYVNMTLFLHIAHTKYFDVFCCLIVILDNAEEMWAT